MKLTLKQKSQLQTIFNNMQKSELFLLKDTTVIAIKSNLTNAKEDTWINKATGENSYQFNKQIGNDLCYLYNAIGSMQNFLNNNQ